ncbi:MAG TPA: PspA/IM30 family protein [Actinomycetota bacterium]|nr:PspA/IM30 family protein [Actinomycetota bacterium]
MRVLRRAWRYLVAALSGRLDEVADPKVQIEQAIEEAKRQHELLSQQAAAVLGNRRQLEMKLARSMEEVEKLRASARQALVFAEQSRGTGDQSKASSYEETAQAFATKLVAAEASMNDLKGLHDQALQAADQARKAVEQNAFLLQKRLAERSRLLSQLDQTKMQERMNEALQSVSELSVPGDVPTLNEVRDKIEARYARALGRSELATGTVEARMIEVEKAAIDAQGAERLEEIRKSLSLESGAKGQAPLPAEQESGSA